ncbi:hypothetical protein [Sabulibacter ruber]|uniref:hypothetical protein n=1 Tax=Sabulibacter ruber TaxID=2811901 RepID=UPI001A96A3C3|nr:hypothetical protein [Sabulibacter ruber]
MLILLEVVSIILGVLIMVKNQFDKQPKDSMLHPIEYSLFTGGLMLFLIGIAGLINELSKLF